MFTVRKPIQLFAVGFLLLVLNLPGTIAAAPRARLGPSVVRKDVDQPDRPATPDPLVLSVVGQYGGEITSVAVAPNGFTAYVGVGQTVTMLDLRTNPGPVQVGATELLPGSILDLTVKRQTVYAVVNRDGLYVIDVVDPAHPVVVGYFSARDAFGVAVAGNYLYLGNAGLTIFDITQPHRPVQVGHLSFSAYNHGVSVSGGIAYVTAGDGLHIVDVSNPSQPVRVGFVAAPGAWSVAVTGGHAYVSRTEYGFDVVDVANPAAPSVVGSVALGFTYGISVTPQTVFVVGSGGLRTFDINDPRHPLPTGIFTTHFQAVDLVVRDNLAYVAARSDGLYVVDVSGLASIKMLGFADTAGKAEGIALAGNHAYVADGYSGLRVLSLADPVHPAEIGSLDTPGYARNVAVVGARAYVTDERDYSTGTAGSLAIIDVTNPAHPTQLGRIQTPDSAMDVAVVGNLAYVAATYSGLRIINVANPAAPYEIGFIDTPGDAVGVSVVARGSRVVAFVADVYYGMRVIDVTDPAHPEELSHLPQDPGGLWTGVAIRGNVAYVTNQIGDNRSDGLYVADISDLSAPRFVGFASARGAAGVTLRDDRAYVHGDDLFVFDLDDPIRPVELGAYESSGPVAVADGLAYQAAGNEGVLVVDVGGLSAPVLAGAWNIGPSADIAVVGRYGFLTGDRSLRVLDMIDPNRPKPVGQAAASSPTNHIVAADGYAYVTQDAVVDYNRGRFAGGGLRIYDLTVPSAPVGKGFFSTPDGTGLGPVAVSGRYVYAVSANDLAPDNKLYVIDAINRHNPVQVGLYTAPTGIVDMAVQGQYVYLVTEGEYLRVLSVANPQQPIEVGSVAIPDSVESLAVAGSFAYIGFESGYTGLHIADVANPAEPSIVGVLAGVRDVPALEVKNQRLHAAGRTAMRMFDLADNPAAPREIGQVAYRGGNQLSGMAVTESLVLLPHYDIGLLVVNARPATHRSLLPKVQMSR